VNPEIQAVLDGQSQGCVVCADCLDVLPELPEGCVDLVCTDPPYGHTENGSLQQRWEAVLGWQDGVGIYRDPSHHDLLLANDGPEANEIFRSSLPLFRRILKPGCCCCCCGGGGGPDPQFARWSLWMDEIFQFKQMVVWDKGPMGMGWHYRRSYETVLVAEVPGAACKWYGGRKVENIIRPGSYGIRKIIPQENNHPTEKPLPLAMLFINLHSEPGDIVLDAFMGHGWACVAAKLLGRRYIGIDISPDYVVIARQRLEAVDTGVPAREARQGQLSLFNPKT
jgi:DNA modification methylase